MKEVMDLSIIRKIVIFTEKHGCKINELSLEYNNDTKKMALSLNMALNLMVHIETSERAGKEVLATMLMDELPDMPGQFITDVYTLYREHGRGALKVVIDRLLKNILTIYPYLALCLSFMNIRYDTIETLS